MESEHDLHNATAVGQVLRYVAVYHGQRVALLTFCSAALHLKFRDHLFGWAPGRSAGADTSSLKPAGFSSCP